MSLTRRRLFQRLATPDPSAHAEWIAARGREAGMIEYGEQGMAAGAAPIRIASNENPLGPGQHVLDAIVGKFPEAHRYPFNATAARRRAHRGDRRQVPGASRRTSCSAPGSGEILTHAVRAFTSPTKPLVTAWPSFESPARHREEDRHAGEGSRLRREAAIDVAKMAEASKGAGLVFFCNPNNPTATVHGKTAVADMVKAIRAASPDTVILIDEAYHDYVTDPSYQSAIDIALVDAERLRHAHLLEGLRHGRAARRLRDRPADDRSRRSRRYKHAVRARHADPRRRHRRRSATSRTSMQERAAQHRGEGLHRQGVRRHGDHRHRLADQLPVHGHQAARRRIP